MGERRGTKGLELWCRRMTEGYPGVKIDNMTTSWRDGLAFCAIIHHFRPELIDFSKLKKNDVYYNNDLAFTIAEKYLGIPALLEAADMVQYDVPDRLSILTYLSQFYRAFVASQGSTPTRIVPKRPATASERGIVSPASTSPPTKMVIKSGGMPRRDPCAKCGLPVFIAERLNVGKLLYHRTCFRCARCNSQLTLANYYETETQNQFCCETCPDEEIVKKSNVEPKAIVVGPSLSDEEKSANFQKPDEGDDDYSTRFETALDSVDLSKSETLSSVKSAEFSRARSHFVASQIENSDSDEEMPPELPKTKPPDIKSEEPKLKSYGRSEIADFSDNSIVNNVNYELNSGLISNTRSLVSDVNNSANVSNQLKAASLELCKDNDVTKEIQSTKEERPSLVKSRSRLFEKQTVSKEPSTPNVGITAKLFKKSPIERSKLSQSTGNIFVPQKSVLKSPENIYDRRRSLSDVSTSLLQKQSSVDKRISTSPKAPIAQKYPSLSSIFQKQSGAEKRKSSPLPEKRSTVSPTKISLDQKYPFGVSSSSKSNPEKSLNSLLQKQISKKLKTSLPDLTKTVKNEDQRVFETPQKFKQLGTNNHSYSTRDLSRQNSEKSRTSRNKFNNEKNVPKEATNGKFVGVSALKNIFEKSSSKVNKKFEKPDDNYSKSVQPVNLEPIECATIDSDINNFSERPQMAIDEALGNENLTQSSKIDEIQDASIDAKCDEKSVVETDSFENENFHLKKDDNTRSETAQIVQDEIKTRSDSNNFVNLVVSSEITEVKHTEQENVSHCNEDNIQVSSEESIQIISEDIPIVIIDDITSDSNENEAITISDDVIEISDASHDEVVIEVSDKSNKNQDYPEDLNPFDDDEEINVNHKSEKSLNPFDDDVESEQTRSPKPKTRSPRISTKSETSPVAKEEKSLNPFDDEEDDDKMDESLPKTPKPVARRKIHANELKNIFESHTDTPEHLQNIYIQRISINPFDEKGDDSATKDDVSTFKSPYPVDEERPRKLKVISAPRDSLNPFWSEDEGDENDDVSKPIPKPRKSKNSSFIPEPKPRTSGQATSSSHGSSTSISSANSGGQTLRKKKPAPRPPIIISEITDSGHSSLTSSPSTSVQHSPRATPKTRKSKKAPLPPTSTPLSSTLRPLSSLLSSNVPTFSPIHDEHPQENLVENENSNNEWEKEKIVKDEVNRTRQSQYFTPPSPPLSHKDYACYTPNKSTYGKWKRKKGPAPSRPVPQKRLIKALPTTEIRRELDLIELQQQGLEKQGVRLEQIIRDRCEGPENNIEDSVPIDVEDLILQLFEVVNEKNELCRRQAELMYLQRQQRLEEEHADVEYQIRCLMLQPEANKTDSDKAREEELINRLVDIVERRNEIIECLEMDRVREAEEDDSICNSLNTYASKRDENLKSDPEILSKKEKKKLKKEKKNKSKNAQNIDIDKDVDESESSIVHSKDKKKKKFALF